MKAFPAAIKKETLVLVRDRAGLGILFIMPLALVIIMALIQDGPYRMFQKSEFPLIFVDNDKDTVGATIEKNLREAGLFRVFKTIDGVAATPETAIKAVSEGKFKAGIIIPLGVTKYLRKNSIGIVAKTFSGKTVTEKELFEIPGDSLKIKYFLDPLTSFSFKHTVVYILERTSSTLISQSITNRYYERLGTYYPVETKINFTDCRIIDIKELDASGINNSGIIFNSVQHNVPAWTMFAIFFIFLPLAGSILKERDYGTFVRLKFMPGSFSTIITGKIILYTFVGCIQFILMLIVGKYLLPALGLPSLIIGNSIFAIVVIIITASLAATAFGVLIGTFFSTHQQIVTFGSISVIILAALGGIWVPVYIMSKTMVKVSKYSPLEWGLNAFNEIFLHNGTFINIYMDALKFLLFSSAAFLFSYLYYRYKSVN